MHVYRDFRHFNTTAEFTTAIVASWQKITSETTRPLVESMPDRLFQVIYNQGASTRY